MANLGVKNGTYIIRFRHAGNEYKRSLKTRSDADAAAAKNSVELTIHRILTGFLKCLPALTPATSSSAGALTEPAAKCEEPTPLPTTRSLMDEYLESQKNMLAESYRYSQKIHLGHFTKHLGDLVDASCDKVTRQHVEKFLYARLAIRNSNTVARERVTLIQFYKWLFRSGVTRVLPLPGVQSVHHQMRQGPRSLPDPGGNQTDHRTGWVVRRGGFGLAGSACTSIPRRLEGLLATVRDKAVNPISFILHAIPAYSGMRRGEVLRLTWIDLDLDNGYVTARSRKQSRTRTETIRRIDLHPELKNSFNGLANRTSQGAVRDLRPEDPPTDHEGSRKPIILAAHAGTRIGLGRQAELV